MYAGLNEGMYVYTSDGERIGKVIRCQSDGFEIEKGFFFPKEYFATYDEISRLDGDRAILRLTKDELLRAGESTGWGRNRGYAAGSTFAKDKELGYGRDTNLGISGQKEELRVPVAEEKLEAEKHMREAGAVRVTKEVRTEQKTLTVPVTREEVRVERVPVDTPRTAREGEALFQGGTVTVPIREEEVEIRKRPVVKEEVRISKTPVSEEKRVSETVRKEEVDVDEGESRRTWPDDSGLHAGGVDRDVPLSTGGIDDDIDKI